MVNTKKFPREYGHGRANYINGPRVAGARSLPAKLDPVISKREARTASEACTGSGPQASSSKRQAFEPTCSSIKQQASKPQASASSAKPQATSSEIREPRNMDIGEVLGEQGPRVFARINVLCG